MTQNNLMKRGEDLKVKIWSKFGLVGCEREEVIEVDDNATDEEIEQEWQEWAYQYMDGGWEKIKD